MWGRTGRGGWRVEMLGGKLGRMEEEGRCERNWEEKLWSGRKDKNKRS